MRDQLRFNNRTISKESVRGKKTVRIQHFPQAANYRRLLTSKSTFLQLKIRFASDILLQLLKQGSSNLNREGRVKRVIQRASHSTYAFVHTGKVIKVLSTAVSVTFLLNALFACEITVVPSRTFGVALLLQFLLLYTVWFGHYYSILWLIV